MTEAVLRGGAEMFGAEDPGTFLVFDFDMIYLIYFVDINPRQHTVCLTSIPL